ncbi:unnamed protein product [Lampetra fluviatilis]
MRLHLPLPRPPAGTVSIPHPAAISYNALHPVYHLGQDSANAGVARVRVQDEWHGEVGMTSAVSISSSASRTCSFSAGLRRYGFCRISAASPYRCGGGRLVDARDWECETGWVGGEVGGARSERPSELEMRGEGERERRSRYDCS